MTEIAILMFVSGAAFGVTFGYVWGSRGARVRHNPLPLPDAGRPGMFRVVTRSKKVRRRG